MGVSSANSMVGDLLDLLAGGVGMDRRCIAARHPVGFRADCTRGFGSAGEVVLARAVRFCDPSGKVDLLRPGAGFHPLCRAMFRGTVGFAVKARSEKGEK
jgi:hypothetical protein